MTRISFKRRRFPSAVIQHAVWLYFRFTLGLRDVEEMLAHRSHAGGPASQYQGITRLSLMKSTSGFSPMKIEIVSANGNCPPQAGAMNLGTGARNAPRHDG